jgi:hypothetical protein
VLASSSATAERNKGGNPLGERIKTG